MKMRKCKICGETKSINEFHHRLCRCKPYILAVCKTCVNKKFTDRYKTDPQFRKDKCQQRNKNRERVKARNPLLYHRRNGISKAKRRKLNFNLLNQDWVGCDYHHLNDNDVVAIPERVHMQAKSARQYADGITHKSSIVSFYGSLKNMIKNTPQGKPYTNKLADEFFNKINYERTRRTKKRWDKINFVYRKNYYRNHREQYKTKSKEYNLKNKETIKIKQHVAYLRRKQKRVGV